MMSKVVAFVPDLMDRSRIAGAGQGLVIFVEEVTDLAAAAAVADVVLVDLSRSGVLEVLPDVAGLGVRVVGFGPHVDGELLEAARSAGCQQVVARSLFFSHLAEFLG